MLKTTLIYEQPQDYYDIFSHMLSLKENASIRELVNKVESMSNTYKRNVEEKAHYLVYYTREVKEAFYNPGIYFHRQNLHSTL